MSWENILKQKFDFNSLNWRKNRHNDHWMAEYSFREGGGLSIIAGAGMYSEPRKNIDDPLGYTKYEVMFDIPDEKEYLVEYFPRNFRIDYYDDGILRYITKEQLTRYVRMIEDTPEFLEALKPVKNQGE